MDDDKGFVEFLMCTAAWLLLKRRNRRRFLRWRARPSVLPSIVKMRAKPSVQPLVRVKRSTQRPKLNKFLSEITFQDEDICFEYTKMDVKTFDSLLDIMGPHLEKKCRRTPLPPRIRLAITLRYLATGESMKSIAGAFNVGRATVCIIVNDTCRRLWSVLAPQYVTFPKNDEEWLETANDFEEKWNLPHCVGAVDCRHVSIHPQKSAPMFCSDRLGTGVVMLAMCDSNYCFTYLDIEDYSEESGGGGIMKTSDFGKIIDGNSLVLPAEHPLHGMNEPVPYYFVGDEGFPLKLNLMRPYAGRDMSDMKKIFNYRLSRVQRCMENVFGILAARWHIYLHAINAHPLTVGRIIKATACLHNFLIKMGDPLYCPSTGFLDEETGTGDVVPGQWRADVNLHSCALRRIGRLGSNMSKRSSMQVRDSLAAYFVSEAGSIDSQWLYVDRGEQ